MNRRGGERERAPGGHGGLGRAWRLAATALLASALLVLGFAQLAEDTARVHSSVAPLAHAPEHAHDFEATGEAPSTVRAASAWLACALIALLGLGLGGIGRRAGRVACASLALLVAVLALETAVHSVHHLGDADAMAGCAVLSASQNATGASEEPAEIAPAVPVVLALPVVDDPGVLPVRPFRSFAGRAPPAAPSA